MARDHDATYAARCAAAYTPRARWRSRAATVQHEHQRDGNVQRHRRGEVDHHQARDHENIAVGEVDKAQNAVDHRVADGDKGVLSAHRDTADRRYGRTVPDKVMEDILPCVVHDSADRVEKPSTPWSETLSMPPEGSAEAGGDSAARQHEYCAVLWSQSTPWQWSRSPSCPSVCCTVLTYGRCRGWRRRCRRSAISPVTPVIGDVRAEPRVRRWDRRSRQP